MIREAKRTAPSIVYVPHIHLWWEIVGPTLKATFITLLQNIPSFAPVLLLATSDKPHSALPEEVICRGESHWTYDIWACWEGWWVYLYVCIVRLHYKSFSLPKTGLYDACYSATCHIYVYVCVYAHTLFFF